MNIYPSTKALAYVYICFHKITGKFYIGYREKNIKLNLPSHIDFPKYKTSSKIVRKEFNNYNWIILAEFFNPEDAFNFEQYLIYENWSNPLLLNKQHRYFSKSSFRCQGPLPPLSEERKKKISIANKGNSVFKGKKHSKESKEKMSYSHKGLSHSLETKEKISLKLKGIPKPKTTEHRLKISNTLKGRKQSLEHSKKISESQKGKEKLKVQCPYCSKIGGQPQMVQWHFEKCKFNFS